MLSTPSAEHQTDVEGYFCRHRAEGTAFLESFGSMGEVVGKRVLDLGCGLGRQDSGRCRSRRRSNRRGRQ